MIKLMKELINFQRSGQVCSFYIITQVPYPSIRIVHNSIASNVYLDCPKCEEVHDATDYDSW